MSISQEDIAKAQSIARKYPQRWNDLVLYEPTAFVTDSLAQRNMSLQRIDDAEGDLNLDFYAVTIKNLPFDGDTQMSEFQLLQALRSRLCGDEILDSSNSEFFPYDDAIDGSLWASDDPIGSVLYIDITGPDNAAVVCVESNDNLWRVCTITTDRSGEHPVSGTREWGIFPGPSSDDGTPGWTLYVRGADRTTSFPEGVVEGFAFAKAKELWQSFQEKACTFINSRDGVAEIGEITCERLNWIAFKEFCT